LSAEKAPAGRFQDQTLSAQSPGRRAEFSSSLGLSRQASVPWLHAPCTRVQLCKRRCTTAAPRALQTGEHRRRTTRPAEARSLPWLASMPSAQLDPDHSLPPGLGAQSEAEAARAQDALSSCRPASPRLPGAGPKPAPKGAVTGKPGFQSSQRSCFSALQKGNAKRKQFPALERLIQFQGN
jgi:hypothetical protein